MPGDVARQDTAPGHRRCRWSSPQGYGTNALTTIIMGGRCALPDKVALRPARWERHVRAITLNAGHA